MSLDKPAGTASKLGTYELLKEQPGASAGSVWTARSAGAPGDNPALFSIVRVARSLVKKPEILDTFVAETRPATTFSHPTAAALVEVGNEAGELYTVTEHHHGESLAALTAAAGAQGLPQPVLLRILLDVLGALTAAGAHDPPLYHGELGPQHVLVGEDGVARVAGIGSACSLSALGTPIGAKNHDRLSYAAPERVRSMSSSPAAAPPLAASADVFSAGVLLWEGLARQRLFTSKIEAAIVQKVLTAPIAALGSLPGATVPPPLEAAVQKALERDPARRTQTAAELAAAVESLGAGAVASASDVAAEVERLAGKAIGTRKTEIRTELTRRAGRRASTIPPPAAPRAGAPVVRKATLLGVVPSPRAEPVPRAEAKLPAPKPAIAPPPPAPEPAPPRGPAESLNLGDIEVASPTAPPPPPAPPPAKAPPAKPPPPPPSKPVAKPPPAPVAATPSPAPVAATPSPAPAVAAPPPAPAVAAPPKPPHPPGARPVPNRRGATLMMGAPAAAPPAESPRPVEVKPAQAPDVVASALPPDGPSSRSDGPSPRTDGPSPRSGGSKAGAGEKLGPGSTLGRYEILMPVARGGMAAVWAAKLPGSRGFQKIFAIKTMLPDVSDDPEFESMFLDEGRVAARIRHPNVVEIIDLGEQEDVLYLVMEWVEGENLGSLSRAARALGGVPMPITLRIASQICAGLHAAHELRDDDGNLLDLVHRDISPANVLVSTSGFVKIVDFGIAKSKGRLHVTRVAGTVKGKTPYLSPEQLGQLPLDRRSDIFSLGALLYVLATGLHPFRGETDVKTMENIALREPVPLRALVNTIPAEFEALVLKALAKNPADRYATAGEMQRAADQVAAALGFSTTEEDVAAFVRKALGENLTKRAQELRAAIDRADGRTPPPAEVDTPKPGEQPVVPLVFEVTPRGRDGGSGPRASTPPAAVAASAALSDDISFDGVPSPVAAAKLIAGLPTPKFPDAVTLPDIQSAPSLSQGHAAPPGPGAAPARQASDPDGAPIEVDGFPRKRKPVALIAISAVLGLCVLIGVVALFSGGKKPPEPAGAGSAAPTVATPTVTPPPATEAAAPPAATSAAPAATPTASAATTASPAETSSGDAPAVSAPPRGKGGPFRPPAIKPKRPRRPYNPTTL